MEHVHEIETINEAIYEAITTKYKKDAQRAHRIVESEGYEIYKNGGEYVVRNSETGKHICGRIFPIDHGHIMRDKDGNHRYVHFDRARHYTRNMNIVAYLDKPYNRAWHNVLDRTRADQTGKAVFDKYFGYFNMRDRQLGYEKSIQQEKERITQSLERIEMLTRLQAEGKRDLEAYKKKLGLIK